MFPKNTGNRTLGKQANVSVVRAREEQAAVGQMFEVSGVPSPPGGLFRRHIISRGEDSGFHQVLQSRGWGSVSSHPVGPCNSLMPTCPVAPLTWQKGKSHLRVAHTRDNVTKTKRVTAPANYFTLNI